MVCISGGCYVGVFIDAAHYLNHCGGGPRHLCGGGPWNSGTSTPHSSNFAVILALVSSLMSCTICLISALCSSVRVPNHSSRRCWNAGSSVPHSCSIAVISARISSRVAPASLNSCTLSSIASLCSSVRLHGSLLSSPLLNAYTVSAMLPKIADTVTIVNRIRALLFLSILILSFLLSDLSK